MSALSFIGLALLVLFVIGGVQYHRAEREREERERYGPLDADANERGPLEPRR